MDSDKQRSFLNDLAASHSGKLRRFLESRLRNSVPDVPDLMQEIFLRLMRVPHPETIRTPEAYLFTIAKAVLHQYRAKQASVPQAIDIMDVLAEIEDEQAMGPEGQLASEQRFAQLQRALAQLPRKAYVTLILNRVSGIPLGEIAQQLGISRPMVKKYLAKALSACRQYDQDNG